MLSIIFVNYKSSQDIEICLHSFLKYEPRYLSYQYIIIDNASGDQDLSTLKRKFSFIEIVYAEKNGGFAYGNNIGIKKAKNDIVLLLNPDTYLIDNSVEKMLLKINTSNIDMLGPKLIYPDGKNQSYFHPKTYPTLWRIFCERFFLHRIFKKSKIFNSYFQTYMNYDIERPVEQICGAALMFKKQIISDIGYLDENYFMYFEESDWCKMAVEKKKKLLYFPIATIVHDEGLSNCENFKRNARIFTDSYFYYFNKNYSIAYAKIAKIIYVIGVVFRYFLYTVNMNEKNIYNKFILSNFFILCNSFRRRRN